MNRRTASLLKLSVAMAQLMVAVADELKALQVAVASLPTKQNLENTESKIMAKIEDLLAEVEDESSVIDGVVTLVENLRDQVKAATGTVLPPTVQAKVDQIFASVVSQKKKLSDALVANTPAEETGGGDASEDDGTPTSGDNEGDPQTGSGENPPASPEAGNLPKNPS